MSALEDYREYVSGRIDDYSEYNPAFHIITKADAVIAEQQATIERLTFLYEAATGPQQRADLERRWAEERSE